MAEIETRVYEALGVLISVAGIIGVAVGLLVGYLIWGLR